MWDTGRVSESVNGSSGGERLPPEARAEPGGGGAELLGAPQAGVEGERDLGEVAHVQREQDHQVEHDAHGGPGFAQVPAVEPAPEAAAAVGGSAVVVGEQ